MKANGDIWNTIANGEYTYRLREVDICYEKANLTCVLREARKIADNKGYGITIDAFYEGRWFQMDIAYPRFHSR